MAPGILSKRKKPAGLTLSADHVLHPERSFKLSDTGTFTTGGFAVKATGIQATPQQRGAFSTLSLDQLEPLHELGSGACGIVRLARHKASGQLLALKIINVVGDKSLRHQVLNELKVLCTLTHPQLVPLYDAFYLEGYLYLALKFMDGGTLEALLASNELAAAKAKAADAAGAGSGGAGPSEAPGAWPGLPPSVLGCIAVQVLAGLEYLHSHNMVHRDLKPANILVESSGGVQLADFGISKQLETTCGMARSFVGTAAYMAPERVQGAEYGPPSDLWSLGVVLVECSQGRHPYKHAKSYYDLVMEISQGETPPRLSRAEYPEALCDICECCLTLAPPRRPTCSALLKRFVLGPPRLSPRTPRTPLSGVPEPEAPEPGAPSPPERPGSRGSPLLWFITGLDDPGSAQVSPRSPDAASPRSSASEADSPRELTRVTEPLTVHSPHSEGGGSSGGATHGTYVGGLLSAEDLAIGASCLLRGWLHHHFPQFREAAAAAGLIVAASGDEPARPPSRPTVSAAYGGTGWRAPPPLQSAEISESCSVSTLPAGLGSPSIAPSALESEGSGSSSQVYGESSMRSVSSGLLENSDLRDTSIENSIIRWV